MITHIQQGKIDGPVWLFLYEAFPTSLYIQTQFQKLSNMNENLMQSLFYKCSSVKFLVCTVMAVARGEPHHISACKPQSLEVAPFTPSKDTVTYYHYYRLSLIARGMIQSGDFFIASVWTIIFWLLYIASLSFRNLNL